MIPNCIDPPPPPKPPKHYTHTLEYWQSWIGLPRAGISTLLKDCWVILAKNSAKGSQNPESFECSSSPDNYSWRLKYIFRNSLLFSSYTHFHFCLHISIDHFTHFPLSYQNIKNERRHMTLTQSCNLNEYDFFFSNAHTESTKCHTKILQV